ncbi:MAG TPA: RNA 2',3'-cyclic phosphodiesterase [Gemmataceae bacterium]|jgi:2'-5' RNA ligase
MARIRAFIGVDIGDTIRDNAIALQERLARTGAGVKWVEAENLHITLLFLGEVDDRDIVPISRSIEAAARREAAFPLRVSGIGAFPTLRRPKVLWGGVSDGADPLRRLYADLEAKLLDLGLYRKEERGYTPHLTLGRLKSERDGLDLAPELTHYLSWEGGRTDVSQLLLYSSERGRHGFEYAVLARSNLNPSTD